MISATVNILYVICLVFVFALTEDSGLMCSYWIGLAFYYTDGQISWRFPVAFQCIFTFAM